MNIQIRTSSDSFRELRESHAYYIDKTEMIDEYLVRRFDKAVLFARPRRFGKTLTMTMFRDFLDIRQDSREIFDGLRIMNYKKTVEEYMNQYPVVFLSLKQVYGNTFEEVLKNFRLALSELCKSFSEFVFDEEIDPDDQKIFLEMKKQSTDEANTTAALSLFARILSVKYKKPTFIIIDEYDVPMAKTLGTPAYEKTRDMIEHMLSYVCKTNEYVKAVILSGCLYTVKNSTYTGVNNVIPYTVLSPLYASSIGFTEEDVKQLLQDAGLPDHYDTVSEWYDGYLFGREKMYCPWDVLLYTRSVLDGSYSEAMGPESYWNNTSETSLDIAHGFLGKTADVNEKFEQLLVGGTIDAVVNDHIPYHRIHENGENIWSALVETGYLTKAVKERMPRMPLRIPNREIREVFRQEVWAYFQDKVDNVTVRDLVNALWAGQIKQAQSALGQTLEATLSFYHEYQEYSYHLILDGFFTGYGYRVLSEQETGYGRSDLIIEDPARNRALLLELKHVEKEEDMRTALEEAQSQILTQKYESRLVYEGYSNRLRYGLAFWKKRVLVERV